MSDNTLTPQDLELLKKPFQPRDHEIHRGFAYIAEEAVTSRLDEVDPAWQFKIISIVNREKQVAATAELTVKGVTRANVGMQVIEYTKAGDREAGEAEKAAATDALKRCARLFGIGRYLLDAPKGISTIDELGKWLVANYAKPASNVTTLPPATQGQPLFNGTAALQPQPEPPQHKPDLTIVQTPPNVPKNVAKNALNGTPVRRVPPAAKDDQPWCEWCGDVPSSPGEPCHKCVQLGATKKDGWNGGNRKPAEALQTFVPEGHIPFHTARFSKPKTKEIVTFIGGTTAMDHIEVSEYVEDGVIGALGIKGYPYEFIQAWNDKQQIQHRDYPLSPNLFASVTIKGGNGQDRNNRRIGEIRPLKQLEADGDAEPEDRQQKAIATAARGFVDGSKKGVIFKTNVGEIKVYSREEMRRDLSEAWVIYAGNLKDEPGVNHTFMVDGMPDLELLYVEQGNSKPGERRTTYKKVVGYRALSIDTPAVSDADLKF